MTAYPVPSARRAASMAGVAWLLAACASAGTGLSQPEAVRLSARQHAVTQAERAFADTMARRNLAAFSTFLAQDAMFVSDDRVLRGAAEIAQGWRHLFEGPVSPFSWAPDRVEVQADGPLAISTGPVRAADGRCLGRYTSTWREDAPGVWHIVLDIGSNDCSNAGPAH